MENDAEVKTENSLVLIPASSVPTLIAADTTDILGKLYKELEGYVPDASTQDGRDEIGSKAKKVGTAKQDFVRLAATQKEEHQKIIKAVNSELDVIETRCDELRDKILAPRVAYLQIEKERTDKHEAAILGITTAASGMLESCMTMPIDEMKQTLASVEGKRAIVWEEFHYRATAAIDESVAKIKDAISRREKYEAEQDELAKLRAEQAERERQDAERLRIEREETIKRESAEKAKKEAEEAAALVAKQESERVERERLAAEEKAKAEIARVENENRIAAQKASDELAAKAREAAEAQERAKKAEDDARLAAKKAENDRKAALAKAELDKLAAVEAERQRVAQEEKKAAEAQAAREKDKKHKAQVNNEILVALQAAAPIDADSAKAIVVAIASGKIPNVKINY